MAKPKDKTALRRAHDENAELRRKLEKAVCQRATDQQQLHKKIESLNCGNQQLRRTDQKLNKQLEAFKPSGSTAAKPNSSTIQDQSTKTMQKAQQVITNQLRAHKDVLGEMGVIRKEKQELLAALKGQSKVNNQQRLTIEDQKSTIEEQHLTINGQNSIIEEQKSTIEKQKSTIEELRSHPENHPSSQSATTQLEASVYPLQQIAAIQISPKAEGSETETTESATLVTSTKLKSSGSTATTFKLACESTTAVTIKPKEQEQPAAVLGQCKSAKVDLPMHLANQPDNVQQEENHRVPVPEKKKKSMRIGLMALIKSLLPFKKKKRSEIAVLKIAPNLDDDLKLDIVEDKEKASEGQNGKHVEQEIQKSKEQMSQKKIETEHEQDSKERRENTSEEQHDHVPTQINSRRIENSEPDALAATTNRPAHISQSLSHPPARLALLQMAYKQDGDIQRILCSLKRMEARIPMELIKKGYPKISLSDCSIRHGLVFIGKILLVPNNKLLQNYLLWLVHGSPRQGHADRVSTFSSLNKYYFWLGIPETVADYVNGCDTCKKIKPLKLNSAISPTLFTDHLESKETSTLEKTAKITRCQPKSPESIGLLEEQRLRSQCDGPPKAHLRQLGAVIRPGKATTIQIEPPQHAHSMTAQPEPLSKSQSVAIPSSLAAIGKDGLTKVENVEIIIQYTFNDKHIIWEALQHTSTSVKQSDYRQIPVGNMRIALIGDTVLYDIIIKRGYASGKSRFEIAQDRENLLSNKKLGEICRARGIDRWVNTSPKITGIGKKSYADVIEAIIGAVELDDGRLAADGVVDVLGIGLPKVYRTLL
jgi:hypothetical protein